LASKKWCAKSSQYEQHVASVLVQGKGWDDGGYGGYGKARALRGRFFLGQLSLAVAVLNKHQSTS
jgi:hypothetical protein